MNFKIVFNNEIHRVTAELTTFQGLKELITRRFSGEVPQNYFIEYQDSDGDHVRICSQEDFSILKEDLQGTKSVKIFILDNINTNPKVNNFT